MDYLLLLNQAQGRELPCVICGATPALHLLASGEANADHSNDDRALCELHTTGLQENSGVSHADILRLRDGRAPEAWR